MVKPSDIADLISAFANAEGGTIVFGISDKRKLLEGIKPVGEDKIKQKISDKVGVDSGGNNANLESKILEVIQEIYSDEIKTRFIIDQRTSI